MYITHIILLPLPSSPTKIVTDIRPKSTKKENSKKKKKSNKFLKLEHRKVYIRLAIFFKDCVPDQVVYVIYDGSILLTSTRSHRKKT